MILGISLGVEHRPVTEVAEPPSDTQPLAAFAAAARDDSAAPTGAHANQKAVSLPALAIVGLIGSFHGTTSGTAPPGERKR